MLKGQFLLLFVIFNYYASHYNVAVSGNAWLTYLIVKHFLVVSDWMSLFLVPGTEDLNLGEHPFQTGMIALLLILVVMKFAGWEFVYFSICLCYNVCSSE